MKILENHSPKKETILVLLMVLFFTAFFYNGGETEENLEIENKMQLSVSIATAEKTPKLNELWFTGSIEGLTSTIISSRYSDQIQAVYVENGQHVKLGEKLFTVDTEELKNNLRLAESDVKKAIVNSENAEVNYNRKKKLFDIGAVSKETFESAAVQLKISAAENADAETKRQIAEKKIARCCRCKPCKWNHC